MESKERCLKCFWRKEISKSKDLVVIHCMFPKCIKDKDSVINVITPKTKEGGKKKWKSN